MTLVGTTVPAGILRLVAIGESNVAIYPAIGGYGVEDIYLGEFSSSPQLGQTTGNLNLNYESVL